MSVHRGVPVSPGRVVGPALVMAEPLPEPAAGTLPDGADREAAAARITAAAAHVEQELQLRAAHASGQGRQVLEATAAMAADPALLDTARTAVTSTGTVPERAVWDAADAVAAMLESLGGVMAERAADVRDVRGRLLAALHDVPAPGVPASDTPFILLAGDLAPADTATLDPQLVLGIATADGGPQSHTAILARQLGIPAIVAARGVTAITGGEVFLDASTGEIHEQPTAAQRELADAWSAARTQRTAYHGDGAGAELADGTRVPLLANVGDGAGARAAAAAGADGIGLLRTEFLFLDRESEPSRAEQTAAYAEVFAAFPGKKVVVRTLDAGADKPLPFLAAADEPNPALGVRGLRTSREHAVVLENQLAAISAAAAQTEADVWVMAPMIATLPETTGFVERCRAHGLAAAGVMVETPAAALRSRQLLEVADFASLGTNDLTQYTMAADRMLGSLAELNDPWQPAVLDLIARTVEGAGARPVGVCGEAAGDPALAVVLVGLGASTLSMTARLLPDVAAVLGRIGREQAREIAAAVREAGDAQAAKATARERLPILAELGL